MESFWQVLRGRLNINHPLVCLLSVDRCLIAIVVIEERIFIGNKDTLSGFFRERRFNTYLVGEIHICGGGLIPNSRRDDFEDSGAKDELYSAFIREIGIPLSRKIRYLSSERSKVKNSSNLTTLFEKATRIIKYGYITGLQREHILNGLDAVNGNGSPEDKKLATELLQSVMKIENLLEYTIIEDSEGTFDTTA